MTVFLQPPPLLRVMLDAGQGHVDVADGESLLLANHRGRLVVTLASRGETHHVLDAEVTRTAWLRLQVGQVERAAELRIDPPVEEAATTSPPAPPKRRKKARPRAPR